MRETQQAFGSSSRRSDEHSSIVTFCAKRSEAMYAALPNAHFPG